MQMPIEISDKLEVNKLIFLHKANLGDKASITQSAKLGIFAHHNNIPHGLRLAIEYALEEGKIRFVICTSTLAQGVNLPIRYLIVTSTYQGKDQIKVRDFQNLMGRTGRAKYHTEGSILFSDPIVYDNRTKYYDSWRWNKVRNLLNPNQTEPCTSTLLSLLDPAKVTIEENEISLDSSELIKLYPEGSQAVIDFIADLVEKNSYGNETFENLIMQLEWKLAIISSIESYLMAHCDNDHPELVASEAQDLAKGTLAYFLANDEQKEQLRNLFSLLARNINQKIPESNKRIVFGKTLYGVDDAIRIFSWVESNVDLLIACHDDQELITTLWPILIENIHNSSFTKCNLPEILLRIAIEWINGKSYYELFELMQSSGAKLTARSQLRDYKIDNIVDLCENGLAYDGMLVLGAIHDFLDITPYADTSFLLGNLQLFQKKLKYGLPSPKALILYEMGFSDRVVSSALAPVFEDLTPERDEILRFLPARQVQIFRVLNLYPSYFSEVYRNLIN